ncbi:MAG: hypothetical protein M1839_004285 [Geoglossum umbratile]|nr:MAG: hypothetical protein M1839_004285 [Geoglossum umbratile]
MAKGTRIRDRVRRVFSRSASNANSNADYYKPGEKMPSKYSGGYSKPHQDMLAAWTFVDNDSKRRASSQSVESPFGSRVHSRMHSRNPSEASNMLKEERTIEEREDQEWSKTNRSSTSEATLHVQDQIPPKITSGAFAHTGEASSGYGNDPLRQRVLGTVKA